jgi:hypothetical protein
MTTEQMWEENERLVREWFGDAVMDELDRVENK